MRTELYPKPDPPEPDWSRYHWRLEVQYRGNYYFHTKLGARFYVWRNIFDGTLKNYWTIVLVDQRKEKELD